MAFYEALRFELVRIAYFHPKSETVVLFAIGTKVRLKHSGDTGEIVEQLGEQMVRVYLPADDMTIPAFIEDLERIAPEPSGKPALKARVVPGKQDKKPEPPPRTPPEIQYNIIKSKGIQLAFDPTDPAGDSPRAYDLVLINDTRSEWLFAFELSLKQQPVMRHNGKLGALSYQLVGTLLFDQLNDAPVIDVDCWQVTTQGTGSKQHKTLKIKPKSFFSKQLTAPLLNRRVHLYLLFPPDEPGASTTKSREEDIQAYTRRKIPVQQEPDWNNPFHEVLALAAFEPEIDLHIEALVADPAKVKANDILRIQLQHFESYIDRAVRVGVPRVFIIHGVGTGKLRNAIHAHLLRMPEVKTFRNEYHARYGYGATEVIFE